MRHDDLLFAQKYDMLMVKRQAEDFMEEIERILSKPASFYEEAMQNFLKLGLANRTYTENDLSFQLFWYRYIHDIPENTLPRYTKRHAHSCFELHFIMGGSYAYYEADKPPLDLAAGDFILIPPQIEHQLLQQTKDAETITIAFLFTMNEPSSFSFHTNGMCEKIKPAMLTLIEMIWEEASDASHYCTHIIQNHMTSLLLSAIRLFATPCAEERMTKWVHEAAAVNVETFIIENSDLIFSVTALAERLHLSEKQLTRIIQNEYGKTPKVLIDSIKIQQAKKLLMESDMTLEQISDTLGFSDHNNFGRFFKRVEGLPPGVFRHSKGK